MNKVLVVLAIFAVAALASEKYKPKKLPCEYELRIKEKIDGKTIDDFGKYTVNGRYLRYKMSLSARGDEDMYVCYRPDITKKVSGVEMIAAAAQYAKTCVSDYAPMEDYLKFLDGMSDTMFGSLEDVEWEHKKDGEYDGKKCTVYYDEDEKDYALYVKDDYPYAFHTQSYDLIFDFEWEAPMDKFVLEDCKGDFAKTPSKDYIFCAASTVKVAVVAVLAALLSALF